MLSPTLQRPLRLARAYPREATIALGALLFSAAAMASVVHLAPTSGPLAPPLLSPVAPPAPPENGIQNVAPDKAVVLNREIPLSAPAGPAAPPFALNGASANTRDTAITCLAQAVYYEAGQESDEGQRGVAQVVLNRVRHPAFPASVCGVVYQGSTRPTGCQFTFTCDGSLLRRPDAAGWSRARKVAVAALSGDVAGSVGYATHYHANYVLPTWAHTLAKTDVIGAHLFYRWSGGWGQPTAFVQRYGGHEASAEALRSAALSSHAAYIAAGMPTAGHPAAPIAAARAEGLPVAQANGRVTLHFTPQARAAVEAAIARPREAEPKAMRDLLDAGAPAADQKPLG
jgi:spore germination cell wall hydrolase CwlJ-like protein